MTQQNVHKIADKMGIKWDGEKNFMAWCKQTVGKEHLDDMSEVELTMIYNRIKNGKYPKPDLQECTIVGAKIENDVVLVKNRDRNYYPKIKVVHELINNIEVVFMLDMDTDYSEGMNEYGIGIINATLQGEMDEKDKKKTLKTKLPSKDGFKIRHALGFDNVADVIESIVTFTGYSDGSKTLSGKPTALNGHTLVGTKKNIFFIENISNRPPIVRKLKQNRVIVRTNHGEVYSRAGYQKGIDRKSSVMRQLITYRLMKKVHSSNEVLPTLNKKYHVPGWANPRRYNYKLWTSTQIMMNLTQLELTLVIDKDTEFLGIERRFPVNYKSKIKVNVEYEHN